MFRIDLGEGLHLEKLETRHADALCALVEAHREALDRWSALPTGTPTDPVGLRAWLGAQRELGARNLAITCGIWRGDSLLGLVALAEINADHLFAVIWGFMAPSEQSRGVGTRSASAMTTYGFEALGLERVEWRCVVDNEPIRRLAERLGCTREGTLRSGALIGSRFCDLAVYGMLAGEWAAARAAVGAPR